MSLLSSGPAFAGGGQVETDSHLSGTAVLRVAGVASDDVLFLPNSRSLPTEGSLNKIVGMPAGPGGIEDLRETTDCWASPVSRSNYLATDIVICARYRSLANRGAIPNPS